MEWKPIEGYKDQYEVSNYGDFHILPYEFVDKVGRNIKRKEYYKWSEDLFEYGGDEEQGRYLGIHLGGMRKTYAHILAAKAFCENPNLKQEVNHKDGNTKNNYCGCKKYDYKDSNLEWVTRKENMEHASANGLINHESYLRKLSCKKNREKVNYDAMKRAVYQMTLEGQIIAEFESISEAERKTHISNTSISSVLRHEGFHKTAGGYNWIYKTEYDKNKDYRVIIDLGSGGRKPIIQKMLDGKFVAEYISIQEACRQTGFVGSSYIGECCAGKRKYYKNYLWEFKK